MAKIKEEFNPKKYMQLAIDAIMLSINEPRDDGKVSPKVGEVILKPDGSIENSHFSSNSTQWITGHRDCLLQCLLTDY